MSSKNDVTGDLIKSKPSDMYSEHFDAIFRPSLDILKKLTIIPEEEVKDLEWDDDAD